MLGYFNNWNIIQLSHKATSGEEIEKSYQVVLDDISDNMDAMVKTGKYGAINTTDKYIMLYYLIKFMPDPYTIQEEIMCDVKISTSEKALSKRNTWTVL